MFKIKNDSEYLETIYVTPSYILNREVYLPFCLFDRKANMNIQLFRYYEGILSLLYSFERYLVDGKALVENNTANEIAILKQNYPILNTIYANSCSTAFNFINSNNITFEDININNIYQGYLNRTLFTSYSQDIINQVAEFINSKLSDYNNRVAEINIATGANNILLPSVGNFIIEDYLTLVVNQINNYVGLYNG